MRAGMSHGPAWKMMMSLILLWEVMAHPFTVSYTKTSYPPILALRSKFEGFVQRDLIGCCFLNSEVEGMGPYPSPPPSANALFDSGDEVFLELLREPLPNSHEESGPGHLGQNHEVATRSEINGSVRDALVHFPRWRVVLTCWPL